MRRERERAAQKEAGASRDLPFGVYLLFSSFVAIAAVRPQLSVPHCCRQGTRSPAMAPLHCCTELTMQGMHGPQAGLCRPSACPGNLPRLVGAHCLLTTPSHASTPPRRTCVPDALPPPVFPTLPPLPPRPAPHPPHSPNPFPQVGSVFEYVNQRAVFDVIQPDSPLYAPILGFFALTGLPTAGFLFYKVGAGLGRDGGMPARLLAHLLACILACASLKSCMRCWCRAQRRACVTEPFARGAVCCGGHGSQ